MEDFNEALREAACLGDYNTLNRLLENEKVGVNSKNKVNGWTALHWASKRGHPSLIRLLLSHGADVSIMNDKGKTPLEIATNHEVVQLLGGNPSQLSGDETLPIVPNYLQNPVFPYVSAGEDVNKENEVKLDNKMLFNDEESTTTLESAVASLTTKVLDVLTVKVRIAEDKETDFVEVDVVSLTYQCLLDACCQELEISNHCVRKIRKLPNVIVRKNRDVERLKEGQELEVVLV
jgi:hypothetical protein